MTIKRYAETIPASGTYEFGGSDNFFLLVQSSAALTVNIVKDGTREEFAGIIAGLYIRRIRPWNKVRILGAAGTTFEAWVGTENADKDETDIRLQIAAISGIIPVITQPNAAFVDTPKVTVADATQAALFAANPFRNAITVFSDEANGTVFLRTAAGVNNIGFILGGGFLSWKNKGALDVRNDTGATVNLYILEET